MARRKSRKRPYIQPPHEVENRRPRDERPDRPHRGSGQPGRRDPRAVEPPSWRRVLKRTPIAFILFVGLVYIFPPSAAEIESNRDRLGIAAFQATVMSLIFIPMSYVMDRLIYRSYVRRQQRTAAAASAPADGDIEGEAVDGEGPASGSGSDDDDAACTPIR